MKRQTAYSRPRWLGVSFFLFFLGVGVLSAERNKIFVLRSSNAPFYKEAAKGFHQCFSGSEVLVDGVLPKNKGERESYLARIKNLHSPSLYVTVGSLATHSVQKVERDAPVVYSMVMDPLTSGVGNKGVTLDVHPREQLAFIRKNFPTFRRIGIVYSPNQNQTLIQEWRKEAQKKSAQIIFKKAITPTEMLMAAKVLVKEADCLIMVNNLTLYPRYIISQFFLLSLNNKFPIIASSPSYVEAGALAGIYAHPKNNGCLAAEKVSQTLSQHKGSFHFSWPKKIQSAINLIVAKRFNLSIQKSTLLVADKIFE